MDYAKILEKIDVRYWPKEPLYAFNYDGSIESDCLYVTSVGFDKFGDLVIGVSDGNFYYSDEIPYFIDKDEAKAERDRCKVKIEAYRAVQEKNLQRLDLFMAGYFLEDEISTIELDKNFVDYAIKKYHEYLVPGVILKLELLFPDEENGYTSCYMIKEDGSFAEIEITIKSV